MLRKETEKDPMAAEFDLVIRGGTVVDGTGRAPIEADVGIKGNRIAAIGTIAKNGADEIDAQGQAGHAGLRRYPHAL